MYARPKIQCVAGGVSEHLLEGPHITPEILSRSSKRLKNKEIFLFFEIQALNPSRAILLVLLPFSGRLLSASSSRTKLNVGKTAP